MTAKTFPATEIAKLLTGVSNHVDQHLQEVANDLHQTSTLLNEAIEKLTASFLAIHSTVTAQQEILNRHLGCGCAAALPQEALQNHALELASQVNAIVTSMQFQDMTDQLIGRTTRRIEGVRGVLGLLDEHGGQLAVASTADSVVAAVEKLDGLVGAQSDALEQSLWKAVRQTRMDSGDIDLF